MNPNVTMAAYGKSIGNVWPKASKYDASHLFDNWDFALNFGSNEAFGQIVLVVE